MDNITVAVRTHGVKFAQDEVSAYHIIAQFCQQELQHAEIIYEPGKCIACGICIQIAEAADERLGMTFVGRGFDVRVTVPFNASTAEGLKKVASECAAACPTAALTLKDEQ